MTDKNLLLISYFYPPLGGPAVQRPCKTVKYLSRLGWKVDVITVREILYHSRDESLLSEGRARRIFRTSSLDPMFVINKLRTILRSEFNKLYFNTRTQSKTLVRRLFFIDDKIGWLPFVLYTGLKALRQSHYKVILVSCGPFSSALGGYLLSRLARIPLILDYRDHWTLNPIHTTHKGFGLRYLSFLEKHLLRKSHLVLTATAMMRSELIHEFTLSPDRVIPVYNGWDEEDFIGMERKRKANHKIRISYLGTLYQNRTLSKFLKAVSDIGRQFPEYDLDIYMIGNFYRETLEEINNSGIAERICIIPQVEHRQAIQYMLDSDILLLVIGDRTTKSVLTGKIFEYLRVQKPVLALTPQDGEAAELLRLCGHTAICDIHDTPEIERNLLDILKAKSANEFLIPKEYERSVQVEKLASQLESLQYAR